MSSTFVRRSGSVAILVGIVALSLATLVGQEIPDAPYTEVPNWGPEKVGDFNWEPAGVDTDAKGNVYYLRRSSPALFVMDPSGKVLRSFGNDMFVWAHGLHVDRQNNIWATDCTIGPSAGSQSQLQLPDVKAKASGKGHAVYKFSPKGKLLMTLGKIGQPGSGTDQFECPADVITGKDGTIYVTDGHEGDHPNGRIHMFTKDGKLIKIFGKKGNGPGEFASPHTLAWDSQGRLFVGDRSNGRIEIFDKDGNFLQETKAFGGPAGIAITSDDTMYVCCAKNQVYVGSAKTLQVTGIVKDVWAEGLAADNNGSFFHKYIIDNIKRSNFCIY